MLVLLLAALAGASPSSCPADLLVANARVKKTVGAARDVDAYVVTVDVTNRGTAAQPASTRQHLEVMRGGDVLASQPIPVLGAQQRYVVAFRVSLPHRAGTPPGHVDFRYVLDSPNAPEANCTTVNDRLTATLG